MLYPREKSELCDLIKDLIDQLSQSSGENLVVADGDDNTLKLQFLKLLEETVEQRKYQYYYIIIIYILPGKINVV